MVELSAFGFDAKITLDTLIALVAFGVSVVSLGTSIRFWRRSFRPIVTVAVKTHWATDALIAYDLVFLNSGTIPAKNIRISADEESLAQALGSDATPDNKQRWLACFSSTAQVTTLHNGDHVSCSFGTTKSGDSGFWKYKATVSVVIRYEGWFGRSYTQPQEIGMLDSDSFTGYGWAKAEA